MIDSGMRAPTMKVVSRIAVGGDGGWDYVSIDQATRKLYITRGASIISVNADTGKPTLALAAKLVQSADCYRPTLTSGKFGKINHAIVTTRNMS